MPRKPRFYLPDVPAHIVQRGNCRQAVFFSDEDYAAYLRWLHEACLKHGCRIHAYVLMTNHVHLLMTPNSRESISRAIQDTGRYYVRYVNRCHGKSGTLWEGRHKGCLISNDRYLLACMRYIELNPVRAGMVTHPADYAWSSYHSNAVGKACAMLEPHEVYLSLGATPPVRQLAYREFFRQPLDAALVHDVRASVQTGTPLGNDRFREQIERTLQCGIGHPRRGRPAKTEKGY
jgi:putative transposase